MNKTFDILPRTVVVNRGNMEPYISLERLRPYLYRVTFDALPEDNGGDSVFTGGCSSFVRDGKLYTNFDWDYSEAASFILRTKDFEGESFIPELLDSHIKGHEDLIEQLPYRIHRGVNNNKIKLACHVLYNDWGWTGSGNKSINLTRLPFLILSKVKSMATISADLAGVLNNLYCPAGLSELGYLLQIIVTDGTTTYAVMPPLAEGQNYILQDISSCPKMTNFRYINKANVVRAELQNRPTGVERWNLMPCELSDLRFTKAYENPNRLSEFIGLRGTTKDSTDAQLNAIYLDARQIYLTRERDGQTWQTMESAVYGDKLEALYIQENWTDNCIAATGTGADAPIQEIDVNGEKVEPVDRVVNLEIPTKLSDLETDTSHLTVSASEKAAWNEKQNDISLSIINGQLNIIYNE